MNKIPTILVVDDEPGMRTYMKTLLDANHYRVGLADGGPTQLPVFSCLTYNWPGNLRELQNFVKLYIVLCDGEQAISELTGGMELGKPGNNGSGEAGTNLKSIVRNVKNGAEAIAIAEALQQTGWKRKKAAALLGISYKALLYKVRQFELHPPAKNEKT